MRTVAALVVALAVFAGCGGQSDEEKAESTALEFASAVGSRDGDKACSMLAPAPRAQVVASGCAEFANVLSPSMKSRDALKVRIKADRADVELSRPKSKTIVIGLVRAEDGWMVADLRDSE